jgi:DNA polymerase-3 subunit beta
MKFIVASTELLKVLQNVGGILNSSNSMPILDNFLFNIKDKVLTITASDLESTMISSLTVETKEEGSIAVPAKTLLDTLKSFPEQPLTFTFDDTNTIEILSDYGKYKLSGFNASEFPKMPELEDVNAMNITAEALSEGINSSLFAAGNDDLRPVMSGVFFEIGKDGIKFVATDAHKLVKYTRTDAKAESNSSFIAPKKPLNILKNILSNSDSEVSIEYNNTNVKFVFDNMTIVSRLIDGQYPNYNAVIPSENPNVMTIDRRALLGSVKRVAIYTNKSTHQVRLKISGSELTISGEDHDFSNEANERLTCAYEGEDIEIGFNSKFLVEMLSNIESENINLKLSTPNRAGIITPSESDNAHEDILMLVMPVMLKG